MRRNVVCIEPPERVWQRLHDEQASDDRRRRLLKAAVTIGTIAIGAAALLWILN